MLKIFGIYFMVHGKWGIKEIQIEMNKPPTINHLLYTKSFRL